MYLLFSIKNSVAHAHGLFRLSTFQIRVNFTLISVYINKGAYEPNRVTEVNSRGSHQEYKC